jgi:hypothetical protein
MAWAGAVIGLVGNLTSASGSAKAGREGAAAYNFNAAINDQNAVRAREAADADILSLQKDEYRALGSQRAGYGAAGVAASSGSVLDVIADTTARAALDQQRRRYAGDLAAQDQMNQAGINRINARSVRRGGQAAASAQVLAGVGSAVNSLYKPSTGSGASDYNRSYVGSLGYSPSME